MTAETCPVCETDMDRYVPTAWHCPECDRDYWKEGDNWWSCDVSGEPELVENSAGSEGVVECPDPDCEFEAPNDGTVQTFGRIEEHASVAHGPEVGLVRTGSGWKLQYSPQENQQKASK